jgi:hypothetical protein
VFPDIIKGVKKIFAPFLQLAQSVPFCGSVLSTSLWVSMHKNAQSKQQIWEVLEGKRTIVTIIFVILVT